MDFQVTGQAQWDAWRAGVLPPVERLAEWLWSIPVPIPNSPLRYVNVYLLRSKVEGFILIDTGWPAEEALDALRLALTQIGSDISEVRGVIITHAHPDHYGLAGEVRELSGAWIAMHEAEQSMLGSITDPHAIRTLQVDYLMKAGASREAAEESAGPAEVWAKFAAMARPDRTFVDNEMVVPDLDVRAVWTPGHTPGHTVFEMPSEGLLVSGDHLLPRISPNITARETGGEGPLSQYLRSLGRIRSLPVQDVLPAHEYRFSGHRARIDYLVAHHDERLTEIRHALEKNPGISTWEMATQLTWSRPWSEMPPGQWGFAVGETLAHLDHLRFQGLATESGTATQIWHTTNEREQS